jgi:hypothetical protein
MPEPLTRIFRRAAIAADAIHLFIMSGVSDPKPSSVEEP